MIPFFHLFPKIAAKETRTITIAQDGPLPTDSYALIEVFCVDPGCDCRRLLINVVTESNHAHLATISHAFEPPGEDAPMGPEQTFLDMFNPQSKWSRALKDLFLLVLDQDPLYRRRLERHYHMVKEALLDPSHPIHDVVKTAVYPGGPSRTPKRNPRPILPWQASGPSSRPLPPIVDPYAPCPCGSGNKFKWCCRNK